MTTSSLKQAINITTSIVLSTGLLFTTFAFSEDIRLPSYNAVYETKIGGINIEGHRSLQRGDDGIYKLSMKAQALLMTMTEESHFSINEKTLLPLRYEYLFKKPLGSNRQQTIRFNWAAMTIDGTYKKPWALPLDVGVSDRLNVLASLRIHLISHGLSNYSAKIADRGKFKEYTLSPQGTETLTTPLGDIDTVVLNRSSDDKTTTFWLAPEMDYQLIKFVQVESDGDAYELKLKSIDMLN